MNTARRRTAIQPTAWRGHAGAGWTWWPRVAIVWSFLWLCAVQAFGAGRELVAFNKAGQKFPGRDLSSYDVKVHRYTSENMDASFIARLADARMLYIGQYAWDTPGKTIFSDPERSAAVQGLLERGGVLFFDFAASSGDAPTRKFFEGLGLEHPGMPSGKGYKCRAASGSVSPLVTKPRKLASAGRAHGAWQSWPDAYDAPIRDATNPDRAAMLVATGVAGKGTIVLSQMGGIFRGKAGPDKHLADNIITLAYGVLPGPGRTVAVYDAFERREPAANTLYLRNSEAVRWHFDDCAFRIPFLLAEPIGMPRRAAPVTLSVSLPAGAEPASVRVCETWGTTLPCQVRSLDTGTREVVCVFEADLKPHATRLLFLYCGDTPVAASEAPYGFALIARDEGFLLRNDRITTFLTRKHASIGRIKPTGSPRNALATWGDIDDGRCNWISRQKGGIHGGAPEAYEAAVLEDGPVRKRVRYSSPELEIVYTLYARSPALFYSVRAAKGLNVGRFTGWAPHGDGQQDSLFYETQQGLKKLALPTGSFYRPFDDVRKFMKESWLAIADARGSVVGEFADWPLLESIALAFHEANGLTVKAGSKLAAGHTLAGAFMAAAQPDAGPVRAAYIAWKNPPVLVRAGVQRRAEIKPPSVPRLGERFLLSLGPLGWFNSTCQVRDGELKAERLLTEIEKLGGNAVASWGRPPGYFPLLVAKAHGRGMGMQLHPHVKKGKHGRACPVAERERYLHATEETVALGADYLHMIDEYEFYGMCDVCRAAYKKTYGMDMPAKMDFSKLAEPAYHNFILYKMNAITDLVRDMTRVATAKRPDIMTFHTTSPNNHYRLIGYHDLETQSGYMTATCTDLYSTDLNATKYMMKHIRGAQGNGKPVFTVNGGLHRARDVAVNVRQHLLAGANGLWHWCLDRMRLYRDVSEANADAFHWLSRTGMGELLARAHPARYLAVLRDRDAFVDSLKRGESTGKLTAYESRIRALATMRNVPTDILFTKHLSREELAKYKVLIVPSERVLSAANADRIAEYVRAGGRVIVEGETLRNPTLAGLCGVTAAAAAPANVAPIRGVAAPLAGIEADVSSTAVALELDGASVLAEAAGKPVLTLAEAGQGRIAAVALTRMPASLVKRLVRFLGGPRPIELPDTLEEKIETNVLTDDKSYVVAAYNPHYSKTREGVFDTRALRVPAGALAVDFVRGVQASYQGTVRVALEPGGFAFVVLGAPKDCGLPAASTQSEVTACAYSAVPGMEFLRIESKEQPAADEREKAPGKVYVGIFKTQVAKPSQLDMGAQAMMSALRGQPGLVPEFIEKDSPSTLGFYDVVIIPNMKRRAPNLSEQWQRNLRAYVEKGGGALLVHHSAGYVRTAAPVFPELAAAPDYVPIATMKVAAEHAVVNGASMRKRFPKKAVDPAYEQYFRATELKAGQEFVVGFPDYIKLEPTGAGQTLVKSAVRGGQGGDPVVVAGKAGRGKVVLSGINIGCRASKVGKKYTFEEALTAGEQAILVNSVYWLAEKK